MSVETRNKIRNLRAAAAKVGASLPASLVEIFDAEPPMPPSLAEVRAEAVREIAAAVGAKDSAKRTDAALDRVARAEAASALRTGVAAALDVARWDGVRNHAEDVIEAFRVALADDFAAMNEHAARVPLTFDPVTNTAESLTPEAFTAWATVKPIEARLTQVMRALAPLYGIGGGGGYGARAMTAPATRQRLARLSLPESPGEVARYGLVLGVVGKRPTDSLNSSAPWFAAVAVQGATHGLVSVKEYRENVETIAKWEREIAERARNSIDGNASGRPRAVVA